MPYIQDILKKNGLTYKGRIDMDDCTVIWLRDGEGEASYHIRSSTVFI